MEIILFLEKIKREFELMLLHDIDLRGAHERESKSTFKNVNLESRREETTWENWV
jgi:hypothetical protein